MSRESPNDRNRRGPRFKHQVQEAEPDNAVEAVHVEVIDVLEEAVVVEDDEEEKQPEPLVDGSRYVKAVCHALQNHPKHAAVQEQACAALWTMVVQNPVNQKIATNLNVVELAVKAMLMHPDSASLQHQGMRLIHGLCLRVPINQQKMVDAGGTVAVFDRVLNQVDNPEMCMFALELLWNICSNQLESSATIVDFGRFVPAIFRVLRAFPGNENEEAIQRYGWQLLWSLATDMELCRKKILNGDIEDRDISTKASLTNQELHESPKGNGALEMVLDAMRRFPKSETILYAACGLLRELACEDILRDFCALGGHIVLLSTYSDSRDLFRNVEDMASSVLCELTKSRNVALATLTLMIREPNSMDLHEAACRATALWLESSLGHESKLQNSAILEILDTMMLSLVTFRSGCGAQYQIIRVICNLARSNSWVTQCFEDNGVVASALESMMVNLTDENVQCQGCALIELVSNELRDPDLVSCACEYILVSMDTHAKSECVMMHASESLRSVVRTDRGISMDLATKICVGYISCLEYFQCYERIQENGIVSIYELLRTNRLDPAMIDAAKLMTVLKRAMTLHEHSARIIGNACGVLGYLKETMSKTVADAVTLQILSTMERFPELEDVLDKALFTLLRLSTIGEMRERKRFIQNVLSAMSAYTSSDTIQECGCALLLAAARSDGADRKSMICMGSLDAVVIAMELHPNVPGLQQFACAAMSTLLTI